MDLGESFAKYVVFFFNFLFVVIGVGMITLGAIVHTKVVDYHDFIESDLTAYPILLIVFGCVIFLIAFLGCCGACKESTCMLFLYSIILLVIVVVEVGVIIAVFTKRDELEKKVTERLQKTIQQRNEKDVISETWNLLQNKFECCGVKNSTDWTSGKDSIQNSTQVPHSCCQRKENEGICTTLEAATKPGCKQAFIEYLKGNMMIFAGAAVAIALIEILGIVFSCCLYSIYRRTSYRY